MKLKALITGFFALIAVPVLLFANNGIIDNISLALKSGNVKELSRYFDTKIELTLLEDEGAYSKDQAEQVVKAFFEKKNVKSFELIHKGSSEQGSQYGIGNLTTDDGTFRTYFYLKQRGSGYYIQELTFEN